MELKVITNFIGTCKSFVWTFLYLRLTLWATLTGTSNDLELIIFALVRDTFAIHVVIFIFSTDLVCTAFAFEFTCVYSVLTSKTVGASSIRKHVLVITAYITGTFTVFIMILVIVTELIRATLTSKWPYFDAAFIVRAWNAITVGFKIFFVATSSINA
jgi:hypothetical protein